MAGGVYDGEVFGGSDVERFGERAAAGVVVVWGRMDNGGLGKMAETVGMIEMPVREEDAFDLAGVDVQPGELSIDLLVAVEIEFV